MNREDSYILSTLKELMVKGRGDELVTRAWRHIRLRDLKWAQVRQYGEGT